MVEAKNKIVIDASAVVKWFVKEGNRERALILRERHVKGERLLSAPDLLAYEVCNSLRYNPEFTEEDVKNAVKSLFELHLELNPRALILHQGHIGLSYRLALERSIGGCRSPCLRLLWLSSPTITTLLTR